MSPLRRSLELLLFGIVPLVLVGGLLAAEVHSGRGVAWDFREAFLPAARTVAHGVSPYGPVTDQALRSETAFVYPPLVAYLSIPFTWMPALVAEYLVSILVVACVPAILRLLNVRDWRCLGAALMWSPVVFSMRLGALSVTLALGLAVVWRLRGRADVGGVVAGLVVATKLFLWPVVLWLFATRRYRAGLVSLAAAAAFLLVPWAILGFTGLTAYPHLLQALSSIEAPESYSLAALLAKVGLAWTLAEALGLAVGLVILAWGVYAGRRGNDRGSFILALVAAIALSPIVWIHYFALWLVPVALLSPSLGPPWLIPVLLFAVPITPGAASSGQLAIGLALAAGTLGAAAATRLPRAARAVQPRAS